MPSTRRFALFVRVAFLAAATSVMACAQVAGLGDIERVDCLDDCEAGVEGGTSTEGGGDDATTGEGGGDDAHVEAGCAACTGSTPVCDTSTDTCVACLSNPDCAAGTVCINKTCTPGCAADHTSCGADGGDCDVDAGICRQCLHDSDCGGTKPRCDTETFQCVPCLVTNDNCAVGTRCVKQGVGMYTCALGCRTIADCFPDGGVGDAGAGAIACCNNSCIDTSLDSFNCGMCGNVCGGDGGTATTCCASTCHDKQTDPNNCGGCGVSCSNSHMSTRTCGAGTCNGTCAAGFSDCNNNKQTDGCEIASGTDPNNCGMCGTVCSNNNMATRTCLAGACNGTCVAGNANCDNTKQMNGCNVSTSSDPNNCGGCGVVCSGNNIPTRTCASGACNGTCAAGSTNCDGTKQMNGCNVDTNNDPNNCGGCGIVCSANHMGTRTCTGGVCSGTCTAGFSDCNNNKQTDGCEVGTSTDPNNCGACGTVCSNSGMSTRTCNGTCNGNCTAGFSDCNNNKQTDGCEIATGTDPNNCGGCGTVCSNNNQQTRTCLGGACNGACIPGAADCDGNKQTDGCEILTSSDPNDCGGCAIVCSANNMASRTCGGSVCNGTCTANFADCNGNKQTDGCETSTTTTSNCSGCGLACNTTTNTGRGCTGTTCTYTACNAGRANCNSATPPDTDGCECALPGCCGTGCATTTHSDGVGQSFYDCTAVGTYNPAQALEACTAYAASIGHPASDCSDGWYCGANMTLTTVCYSPGGTPTTYCWGYKVGEHPGWVEPATCPASQLGTWN